YFYPAALTPGCTKQACDFTHALVPTDPGKVPAGMKVTEVADMGDALRVLPRGRRAQAPREE
ncbi:hypothetical protein ABZ726_20000, partial [Streptomyces hundungensis]